MYSGEQIVDDIIRMVRKDTEYEVEKQVRNSPVIDDILLLNST